MKRQAFSRRPVLVLTVGLTFALTLGVARAETEAHQRSLQVRVLAGGGVGQFVSASARSVAEPGGVWQLRSIFTGTRAVGGELAYVGNVQNVRLGGTAREAELFGHGAEAVLRLNTTLPRGHLRVEPFVFGGVGWTRYQTSAFPQSADRSRVALDTFVPRLRPADRILVGETRLDLTLDRDDVLTLPAGAGIDLGYGRFILDARLTVRPAFGEDGLLAQPSGPADLGSWFAGVALGYQL